MVGGIASIAANAIVPDQIVSYVTAVSGLETDVINNCAFHHGGGYGILVAYPWHNPLDQDAAEAAVEAALARPGLENLTVISMDRPRCAPQDAVSTHDAWWLLDLPVAPAGKLANMLRRASSEAEIRQDEWGAEHGLLVEDFCRRKALASDTAYLFGQLGRYVESCADAALFSARLANGALAAFAIADYSPLATAFYMFAFRAETAPPGSSDLLLQAIVAEAEKRGHTRLNLGLGINSGIGFFKRKWGAAAELPFVETSWKPAQKRKSFFGRLFGRKE